MLRPLDIAVLLRLTYEDAHTISFQQLGTVLYLSSSEVHAALQRARLSGLTAHPQTKVANRSALLEFLEHGLRYSFPAERGEITRGVPTAYAAEPLCHLFPSTDKVPPVWPHVKGEVRGMSFTPLYKRAADAALADARFYELLSLVDALRDGRVRERKAAIEALKMRIGHHAS